MCWSQARAWVFPTLLQSSCLHTLFDGWARLSGMLVLHGTYRDHDKEKKPAGTLIVIGSAVLVQLPTAERTPHFPCMSS